LWIGWSMDGVMNYVNGDLGNESRDVGGRWKCVCWDWVQKKRKHHTIAELTTGRGGGRAAFIRSKWREVESIIGQVQAVVGGFEPL